MFIRHLPPQQRAILAQRRFGLQIFGLVIVPLGPFQNYVWYNYNFCLVCINLLLQLFKDARKPHSAVVTQSCVTWIYGNKIGQCHH